MARRGEPGKTINLRVTFYLNGALYSPYSIQPVTILTAREYGETVETLSTPTQVSTGLYEVDWAVPADQLGATYYDKWTWTAESGMASNTRIYDFLIAKGQTSVCKTSGPLFVGEKEINFFHSVNKEVIQRIIAQRIIYYSVSEKHTTTHGLYDEAIKKTTHTPVEINALVMRNDPEQTVSRYSIDTMHSIEVYFHNHELDERKITPRVGDFIKWKDVVYEIEKLTQPQIVYGQIQEKMQTKAICRTARKGQFETLDDFKSY